MRGTLRAFKSPLDKRCGWRSHKRILPKLQPKVVIRWNIFFSVAPVLTYLKILLRPGLKCAPCYFIYFFPSIFIEACQYSRRFFYRRFCGGRGGGAMTGQILGQAVAVTGAPSDVFDNYSSTQTQRP